MKTLYFIRHAESEANLKDILASRQDFPLTAKGRADAAAIAAEFKELATVDRIVSSPLLRARETALPFTTAFGLPLEVDERLTEQELGVYAGLTYDQIETAPGYMHDRTQRWEWIPNGGGESYEMIAARLHPFFEALDPSDTGSTLFITHAVTLRLIRATLEAILPDYPRDIAHNGEIWKVNYTQLGKAHTIQSIFLGDSKASISRA